MLAETCCRSRDGYLKVFRLDVLHLGLFRNAMGMNCLRNCFNGMLCTYLHHQVVPYENTAKYLGMTLDAKLGWKPHVKKKQKDLTLKYKKCVDKENQLDVTFCILYFSSNSCATCFDQPCAHHQDLTTA